MIRPVIGALVVLLVFSMPVAAQERPPSSLAVTGEGVVEATPDMAVVEVGVQVQRRTAAEAQQQASEVIARVIGRLASAGVPRPQIETATISLFPVRRPPREGQAEEIAGYQATHMLRARVERIDRIGTAIDAAVGAGANQLGGVTFTLRDPSRARTQALQSAVRDARAKAETIAQAAGVTLGGIERIEEGGAEVEPRVMRVEAMAATPVLPGRVTVRAQVRITFRI